ncbi:hypothetical protein [Streptomyces sp. WM6378]|uniref:hypothetical protein n=1 Tax=Streptomyces sp. WM6378 TaxID=1415557 RepID=UPI00099BE170|nr:hypothetical protein [Streptomyces sp. WM6378]
MLKPQVVDFGPVALGEIPPGRVVTVSLSDDSMVRYAWVLKSCGDFWDVVELQPVRDVSAVKLRLRVHPLSPHDGMGPRHDQLRLVVDDLVVMVPVCMNVVEPAPPPPPARPSPPPRPRPPRRPTPPPSQPPKPPRLTLANWRDFRLTCLGLFMLLNVLVLLGSLVFAGICTLLNGTTLKSGHS